MAIPLGTFSYGSGVQPNRKLSFFGDGETVWYEFYNLKNCGWHKVNCTAESALCLEIAAPREYQQTFDKLAYDARVDLIHQLFTNY